MRRARTLRVSLCLCLAGALAGCSGGAGFGLSFQDNNPDLLARAFERQTLPETGKPVNRLGKPLVFLVARPNKKKNIAQKLIAYDLAAKKELWRVTTDVKSRVVVGRDFVAHLDGTDNLVARAIDTGQPLWSTPVDSFLGAAADAERVYYVRKDAAGKRARWYLVAVNGATGARLWRVESPGLLGTPKALGGLVFSPFLKQWLAILDARTGKQLARIRGEEEEIAFVRAAGDKVYFGSRAGVFLLDERAASGRPGESTYGRAKLPEEFVRSHYYWDAFDTIQAGYSAYDRNRLLWRGRVEDGSLAFQNDLVVVYTYRFFFGFASDGSQLRWAYNHPRIDAIGAAHVGSAIAFASGLGDLGALDPDTGQRIYGAKIDDQFVGATFDAEGWRPDEEFPRTSTVGALTSIARDRDARFGAVKQFAVAALATLPGAEVTRDLIELVQNESTPAKLYQEASDVLIARQEPAGFPYLLEALDVRHDFIAGTRPRAVGVVARAVGTMGQQGKLDAAQRGTAIDALLVHLTAPDTPPEDLVDIIGALGAMGQGAEIAPLRSFLLAYRGDPAFATQIAPLGAAIDVLARGGGAAERELIAFLADDPRTQASVAEYARRAFEQTTEAGKAQPPQPGTTGSTGATGSEPAGSGTSSGPAGDPSAPTPGPSAPTPGPSAPGPSAPGPSAPTPGPSAPTEPQPAAAPPTSDP